MKTLTKLAIGLGVLAVVSPLGLYLPHQFKAGDAWGEWNVEKLKSMAGYVPRGFERLASWWHALLPNYSFKGWEDKGLVHLSLAYIVSAIVGIVLVGGAAWLLGRLLARKQK